MQPRTFKKTDAFPRPLAAHLRQLGLLTSLWIGGTLLLTRPAAACGATPCAQRQEVLPSDGSRDVPTNTELRVLYFGTLLASDAPDAGCEVEFGSFRLLDDADVILELYATAYAEGSSEAWFVAQPAIELEPHRGYRLQLNLDPGGEVCRCEGTAWTTVSSFTTGSGSDTNPPRFSGATGLMVGDYFDHDTSCGRSRGFPVHVEMEPAEDESPDVRYNVYADGERIAYSVVNLEHKLAVACGASALTTSRHLGENATIEIRAVDLAGNESPSNAPRTLDVTCASGAASQTGGASGFHDGGEAGASGAGDVDSNVARDSGGSQSDPVRETRGGCTFSERSLQPGYLGWLVAFGLVLGARARLNRPGERAARWRPRHAPVAPKR